MYSSQPTLFLTAGVSKEEGETPAAAWAHYTVSRRIINFGPGPGLQHTVWKYRTRTPVHPFQGIVQLSKGQEVVTAIRAGATEMEINLQRSQALPGSCVDSARRTGPSPLHDHWTSSGTGRCWPVPAARLVLQSLCGVFTRIAHYCRVTVYLSKQNNKVRFPQAALPRSSPGHVLLQLLCPAAHTRLLSAAPFCWMNPALHLYSVGTHPSVSSLASSAPSISPFSSLKGEEFICEAMKHNKEIKGERHSE